jgi:hypothetical protein
MPSLQTDAAIRFGIDKSGGRSRDDDQLFKALRRLLLAASSADTSQGSWAESLAVPDANDVVGLLRRGIESAEFQRRFIRDSYSAEPGDAVRDDDEEQPGKHKIIFRTKEGVETCYRGLPIAGAIEPERNELADRRTIGASDTLSQHKSPEEYMTALIVKDAPAAVRVAVFNALRGSPLERQALAFLAAELSRGDIEPEWRDAAVFLAEDIHFPPEIRDCVCEALLNIVSVLRAQQDAPEKVVWSALRRGVSLLSPTNVPRVLPFLTPGGTVDIRSVALQSISRLYEAEPPTDVPLALAARAHRFAERFLDSDVFTPGEPSLIARSAVSALAALGDPRLGAALAAVRALGRAWFIRRVRDELNRIYRGWVERGCSTEHPAVANLANSLATFI